MSSIVIIVIIVLVFATILVLTFHRGVRKFKIGKSGLEVEKVSPSERIKDETKTISAQHQECVCQKGLSQDSATP